jgi:hypothetical protein
MKMALILNSIFKKPKNKFMENCEKCNASIVNGKFYKIVGGLKVCADCNKKTPWQDRTVDFLDD